jgi:GT2 family glycosyltransferase
MSPFAQRPSTSVIIAAYRDTEALQVVLDALMSQTELPGEVILAEDGSSSEVEKFCSHAMTPFPLIHTSGPDNGWTKNVSLNRAVRKARGDLLLFLDEDCPPFPGWIAAHIASTQPGRILAGRRVELGPHFSSELRAGRSRAKDLAEHFLKFFVAFLKDGSRHLEEGIVLYNRNPLVRCLLRFQKKIWLVGCDWSCWRSDLEAINGFDEDFNEPCYGEDIDIERRFRTLGFEIQSVRNLAPVFHLHHAKRFNEASRLRMKAMMENRPKRIRCLNGLVDERQASFSKA